MSSTAFTDATLASVEEAMQSAYSAFRIFQGLDGKARAAFLRNIAAELDARRPALLSLAKAETNLSTDRLSTELQRTLFQLTSYADACEEGTWLDIRIDTADALVTPPRPDLRKASVPLGPVVVFGASNFPFAYSTAGGDTASALAAGCTVVVKAHPAHAHTSEAVANAVHAVALRHNLPPGVFLHLHGAAQAVGEALVTHRLTAAVAFTGSFQGGTALFRLANARPIPIPVFAEMGSVNPVFLLPAKLQANTAEIAALLAASITQSVGQFCTNPGLIVGIRSPALDELERLLGEHIKAVAPQKMLHAGIAKSFAAKRLAALADARLIATNEEGATADTSIPTIAAVSGRQFLQDSRWQEEVFGPFSLLVSCDDEAEQQAVAMGLKGQLTCTLWATAEELLTRRELLQTVQSKCGRLIVNGVPTGVTVATAMHHGGPFPATTDSRFTAVGADALRRFVRPVCYQNFPHDLLPPALQNSNPLGYWRTVNNQLTKAAIN